MTSKDVVRNPARSTGGRVNADQLDRVEIEEASQRLGPLAEIPGVLRELGCDPAQVMAGAGLDADACDAPASRIPFVAVGRLLYQCAVKTGCEHFALLVGQRTRLSQLGLPGQLVRHSPTLGAAIRTFAVYQHLNSQGMAKFLLEEDGMATLGTVVYQKGTEHADQIYDLDLAATLTVIRELCGRRWSPERVLVSHTKPAGAVVYRRLFQAPCRFDSERTALLFPAPMLEQTLSDADSPVTSIGSAGPHKERLRPGVPAAPDPANLAGRRSGFGRRGRAVAIDASTHLEPPAESGGHDISGTARRSPFRSRVPVFGHVPHSNY